jgi:hypothetical protein
MKNVFFSHAIRSSIHCFRTYNATKFIIFFTLLLLFHVQTQAQSTTETIDNKKVAELSTLKLGDDVVIGLLHTSPTNFDCSINSILKLKSDNVSEKVIAEILRICSTSSSTTNADPNNPNTKQPSGIYILQHDASNKKDVLKKLYATVVSGQKSGGFGEALLSHYTYGLSKNSIKAQISGANANVKCNEPNTFYFYFESNNQNLDNANWWFYKASSPNEFSLIRLKVKGGVREFTKGTSDAYTQKTGIDENQKIPTSFEEIKPGVFKVTTNEPLQAGEYSFVYSSAVPTNYLNDKVFDFSVASFNVNQSEWKVEVNSIPSGAMVKVYNPKTSTYDEIGVTPIAINWLPSSINQNPILLEYKEYEAKVKPLNADGKELSQVVVNFTTQVPTIEKGSGEILK